MREAADLNGTLNHRPDLLGDAEPSSDKKKTSSGTGFSAATAKGLLPPGAALDLERVLAVTGDATTSDDDDDEVSTAIDAGDAASIRKQLDGLENMSHTSGWGPSQSLKVQRTSLKMSWCNV